MSLTLEPRLREYMNKKTYYTQNHIETVIPLETQYKITNIDKEIIKAHLRGDKKTVDEYSNKNVDFVPISQMKFPTVKVNNDAQNIKLQQKINRDRKAQGSIGDLSKCDFYYKTKILSDNFDNNVEEIKRNNIEVSNFLRPQQTHKCLTPSSEKNYSFIVDHHSALQNDKEIATCTEQLNKQSNTVLTNTPVACNSNVSQKSPTLRLSNKEKLIGIRIKNINV